MAAKPIRFRVIPTEEGLPLRNLLLRRLRDLDRRQAAELIRAGGVYVNRLRVRLPQVLVAPGERITVYREALEAEPVDPESLVFVHRGEDFVVLDKPAGVPVAAVREAAVGTLSEALISKLSAEGVKRPYVGVVHRLDRGASGLVLFTIRDIANKSLHKQFRDHRIRRGYRILARGEAPAEAEFCCEAPLIKLRSGVKIGQPGDGRAKAARTHFRHLGEAAPGRQLFEVELETGRTHQIRVHAAHLGLPVVGDHRYGPDADADADAERLHLHAWRLDFEHPITGEPVHLEAALPDWARED